MAGFSAADAAFTGFRVVWERPWMVAIWAAVQFVVTLAVNLFMLVSAGPVMARFASLKPSPDQAQDSTAILGLAAQAAPTFLAVLMASLVLTAVFWAAMNRAVMKPSESRIAYLRLATDELRQLGLIAALVGLIFCFYMAIFLAGSVIAILLSLLAGQAGVAMAAAAMVAALIVGLVYFAVRLSLSSALTFATGRIHVLASWTLTRDRFWPLLGTYFIAVALSLFVNLLTLAIALAAVALGGGMVAVVGVFHQSANSISAVLAPTWLLYLAITSIGAALSAPITMCPPAAVYVSLTGGRSSAVGRVFD